MTKKLITRKNGKGHTTMFVARAPQKVIVMRDPSDPPRLRKPKSLLNPKQVRSKLLAVLKELRPELATRMSRVSPSCLTALEGDLLNAMRRRVQTTPSVGKTLKFESHV